MKKLLIGIFALSSAFAYAEPKMACVCQVYEAKVNNNQVEVSLQTKVVETFEEHLDRGDVVEAYTRCVDKNARHIIKGRQNDRVHSCRLFDL